MLKIIDAIKWLVKLPVFWMPEKWKGYRRLVITWILAACVMLQGFNLVDIAQGICDFWVSITGNPDCNFKDIAVGITGYIAALYEALKGEGEPSVFNPTGKK